MKYMFSLKKVERKKSLENRRMIENHENFTKQKINVFLQTK